MKIKCILFPLSLLATASFAGIGLSKPHTHTHTHSNLNVGNSTQESNFNDWVVDDNGLIEPRTNEGVVGDIVVPATFNEKKVNGIAPNAFSFITDEFNLTISEGLTSIGEKAFWYSNIQKINIPRSLIRINSYAFAQIGRVNNNKFNLDFNTSWTLDDLGKLSLEDAFVQNAITINAKNTDGKSHDKLDAKYHELFDSQGASELTINVEKDTSESNDTLAPILGGTFGGIALIGLITGGIVSAKKRR